MGKFFDHIPGTLIPWINSQQIFYVATAPLSEDGHVNVSPKGFGDTMHIVYNEDAVKDESAGSVDWKSVTSNTVWYEDLTGSGNETISHVNENGRITVMFVAFEGPPRIVRFFGTARVHEFGTPEYDALLPADKRQPGSRAVIWVDIHKVGTSCGYSIPFFTYKAPRYKLHRHLQAKEQDEFDHYASYFPCEPIKDTDPTPHSSMVIVQVPTGSAGETSKLHPGQLLTVREPELPPSQGLKNYWKMKNMTSIDGLPGLVSAPESTALPGNWRAKGVSFPEDDESTPQQGNKDGRAELADGGERWREVLSVGDMGKMLVVFGVGVLVSTMFTRLQK